MQKRIKYFLAVANCLNFTQAAQRMFISQQALSRQISLLEEELGVKLFLRTTRSIALTEAGKVCRDAFSKLDADMDRAIERIRDAALANTCVVTIGFYSFFSRDMIIAPIMESLYQKFPEVEFKIILYNFQAMRYSLLDGESDLCIFVSSDWRFWTRLHVGVLRTLPFKLWLSSGHPLAACDTFPGEALKGCTWFLSGNIDMVRTGLPEWYDRVPCKAKRETGDFLTSLAYVAAGQGFSCHPAVFQGAEDASLRSFDLPFPDAKLDMICAYSDTMANPLVLSIAKHIREFASLPQADAGRVQTASKAASL